MRVPDQFCPKCKTVINPVVFERDRLGTYRCPECLCKVIDEYQEQRTDAEITDSDDAQPPA